MSCSYQDTIVRPKALLAAGCWVAGIAKRVKAERLLVIGTSGISVGAVASALSGVSLLVLRKPTEPTHGYAVIDREVRIAPENQRVLLLDDFVGMGATLATMLNRARKEGYATFLGCALYASRNRNPAEKMREFYSKIYEFQGQSLPEGFVFWENMFV